MANLPPRIYNRATNPSFETALAPAVVRTNYATNPSYGTDLTGATGNYGTGGAGTLTRVTSGGALDNGAFSRMTWTTASTAIGGYHQSALGSVPVGQLYITLYARCNTAQRLQMTISSSGGPVYATLTNPAVDMVANQWMRLTMTVNVTTGGAGLVVRVGPVTGGSGHLNAVGNTLDVDCHLAEVSTTMGAYFDGSTAGTAANARTYAWTGTVNNSTSTESIVPVKNFPGIPGVTLNFQCAASPDYGTYFARCESLVNGPIDVAPQDCYRPDGAQRTAILKVRANRALTVFPEWRTAAGAAQTSGNPVALTANVWTEIRISGAPAIGAASAPALNINAAQVGDYIDFDRHLVIDGTYTDPYFDGDGGAAGWSDQWSGLPHDSESSRDATGLWVDVDLTGTAHTVLTVLGLGPVTGITKIVRTDGRNTFPVPGWLGRRTTDADTGMDYSVPLGRPVTYTLFKDGISVATRTVTVNATTGDIMDPANPAGAISVATAAGDPTALVLGQASMKSAKYANTASESEYPLGGKFPIVRTGVRGAAQEVPFVLQAYTNAVSDALLDMVGQAPVLLIRSLPSWGSVPTVIYTADPVEEQPFNRGRGGQYTEWRLDASAVAPVTRAPRGTQPTNNEVAANLTGRTHDSIQAASGTKRWVEILANPLGLGQ